MKTKEELNTLKNEVEILNKKLAELTDDEMKQVTGGQGESGRLDAILYEVSNWLNAHPNATNSDIYKLLYDKMMANADKLTEDELRALNELMNSFRS